MLSLTAAIVALTLGAGDGSARGSAPAPARGSPGATLSNAQRARLGLLPRKAPKKVSAARQKGRRIITTVHQPTFLGEPAAPEEVEAYAEVEAIPTAEAPPTAVAPREVRDVRLAASRVVTEVTILLRYAP